MKRTFLLILCSLFTVSAAVGCSDAIDKSERNSSTAESPFGGKADNPFEDPDTVREEPIVEDTYIIPEGRRIIFRNQLAETFSKIYKRITDEDLECAENTYEETCIIEPAEYQIADTNDPRFAFRFDSGDEDAPAGILYRSLKEHGEPVEGLDDVYREGAFSCATYQGKEFTTCRRSRADCNTVTLYRCRVGAPEVSDTEDIPEVELDHEEDYVDTDPYQPERYSVNRQEVGGGWDYSNVYVSDQLASDLATKLRQSPTTSQSDETFECNDDQSKCRLRVAVVADYLFKEDTILRVLGHESFTNAANNLYKTVKKHGKEVEHRDQTAYASGRFLCKKSYRFPDADCSICGTWRGPLEMYDCAIREVE